MSNYELLLNIQILFDNEIKIHQFFNEKVLVLFIMYSFYVHVC